MTFAKLLHLKQAYKIHIYPFEQWQSTKQTPALFSRVNFTHKIPTFEQKS